jgi:hypothetical protein
VTEKLITDWRAATAADAAALAKWGQLHGPLSSTAGLQGEPKIRNDDQLMVVLCVSKAAQERVTRAARDAASLAQEWHIAHKPPRGSWQPWPPPAWVSVRVSHPVGDRGWKRGCLRTGRAGAAQRINGRGRVVSRRDLLPALGVVAKLAEIQGDAWFIADHFGVVARMERVDISGADLAAGAVVGVDLHSPGENVAEV